MLKVVLVALDRSDLSQAEVTMLRSLQLGPNSKVVLAHAIPVDAPDAETSLDRPHGSSQEHYRAIEQQLQTYQGELPCPSHIEIVCGDPADEIVRLANIHRAELIVIGSRGLSGMDRILQGSVSSDVIERAACSVLVVKAKGSGS